MSRNYSKVAKIISFPLWVIAGLLIADLIISFLILILQNVLHFSLDSYNQNVVTAVFAAALYSLAIVVTFGLPLLIRKRRISLGDVGLDRLPNWLDIFITPFSVFFYFLISISLMLLVVKFMPWVDMNQVQETGFENLGHQYEYVLTFFTLVVVAPVAEEILFRGYLFGKLRQVVPLWVAVLVTSLTFGLVHGAWNLAIDTFALSVVLCLLREKTGSIWSSILLHMSKNGIAFYVLFISSLL
ncbi:MAG: type II CAAX endopeptidase family protein [Candidatus Saccharimonadaceae bacterium]|nr:type II CAAX endopeptidase family protein [Candidatus Saccharimonadaceae bacterium]